MEKTYISTQKYILESPRKLRLVVGIIKKLKPVDAVEQLPFVQKRAGEVVSKVIKTALANAKSQGVSETDLVFKEIQVGEGPRLKRGRPASRGRWHPYAKRMSHLRVVLKEVKAQAPKKVDKITEKSKKVEPKSKKTDTEQGVKSKKDIKSKK